MLHASPRFELLRVLGTGGMGAVYEARDRFRGRLVAVKTLSGFEPFRLYCLKNEFRSLADVAHPNLVALYELLQEGDSWWLVMERLQGVSLDRWVRPEADVVPPAPSSGLRPAQRRGVATTAAARDTISAPTSRPDLERIRSAFSQVAQGLAALHAAGKVHRDLKPSNVIVEPDGRAVLLDFGLVVDRAPSTNLDPSTTFGTVEYLAPERIEGRPATPASDWYALGVMLYEGLAGQLPLAHLPLSARVTAPPPPPLHRVVADVPEDLGRLCRDLLARDPSARPGAARVLRVLRGAAVSSERLIAVQSEPCLFGRDRELAQLFARLAACRRGAARLVRVVGESGVGKTALLDEFLHRLRHQQVWVLRSRCLVAETSPFKGLDGLVDALVSHLLSLPEQDLAGCIPRDVDTLCRMFPVLQRVEPIAAQQAASSRVAYEPARSRRRRALDALGQLCRALSSRRPLVLCIDDVQWGDEDGALLLRDLIGRGHLEGALVVMLSHPPRAGQLGAFDRLAQELDVEQMELGPLSAPAAEELVRFLLRVDHDHAAVRRLVEVSMGHPIFLLQLVEQANARRSLEADASDLEQLVMRRRAGLTLAERELTELLSLVARPLSLDALRALCGPESAVESLTRKLSASRWLRVSGTSEGPGFELFHEGLRVLVEQSIEGERLPELHRRIAVALHARCELKPEHLSRHFERAGLREEAVGFAMVAAREALSTLAFARAVVLCERTLSLLARDDVRRRDVLLELAASLEGQGAGQAAAEVWLEAVELTESPTESLALERRAAEQWLVSGQLERALSVLHHVAKQVGLRTPRGPLAALGCLVWYRLLTSTGSWLFRLCSPTARGLARARADASFAASRALSLMDTPLGLAMQQRALWYAFRGGEPVQLALNLAWEAAFRGALAGTADAGFRRSILRAEAVGRDAESDLVLAWCALARGLSSVLNAEYAAGIGQLDDAERLFRRQPRGVRWELTLTHVVRAGAFAWGGHLRRLVDDVGAWIADADDRRDAYASMVLRVRASNGIRALALGTTEALAADIEAQLARWPEHTMVRDVSLRCYGEWLRAFCALARGDAALAQGHITRLHAQLSWRRAFMPRAQRAEHEMLSALVALSLPQPRWAEARRYSQRLRRDPRPYGLALAGVLEAACLLRAEQDAASALAFAEQACANADMAALWASVRLLKAQLEGGRSAASGEAARGWLCAQGVVDPLRFAQFWLTPWRLGPHK